MPRCRGAGDRNCKKLPQRCMDTDGEDGVHTGYKPEKVGNTSVGAIACRVLGKVDDIHIHRVTCITA